MPANAGPVAGPRLSLDRMKTRPDFLRAQKGRRQPMPGLTLETCPTPPAYARPSALRVGFTASRKVGNAVARNRAKRRLRALAAEILPLSGREGLDYVLIARTVTVSRPFNVLAADLTKALRAAHTALGLVQAPAEAQNPHAAPLEKQRSRDEPGTKQA
jgi:ribonuclease P protein component